VVFAFAIPGDVSKRSIKMEIEEFEGQDCKGKMEMQRCVEHFELKSGCLEENPDGRSLEKAHQMTRSESWFNLNS
jgi:hypothetical protein